MEQLTGWRRVASAMWHAPDDPQIYGVMDIDATRALAFLRAARARGSHLTATHLVGRAVAHALRALPELNVRIRHGRFEPRESIEVFFITAVGGGRDLSGVKVVDADRKSATEIADELSRRASALKSGSDPVFARTKRTMESLPFPLMHPLLRLFAWLAGDLARSVPLLGLEASPFGSAMVTSVGMFGIPMGFAPLAWMYKVPLLILVGEIAEKPVAVDGHVEVRPMLPLTATIDHRYVDGWHVSQLIKPLREYLSDPAAFEPAFPPVAIAGTQAASTY